VGRTEDRVTRFVVWAPAAILAFAATFTVGIDIQRSVPLRTELSASVPDTLLGFSSRDEEIPEDQRRVAGMTNYLLRYYTPRATNATPWVQVYVGYYDHQTQGRTIHSPKNCLPGAGWEPLASRTSEIATASGPQTVNRYLLKNKAERALVLYWYQGRGRFQANEYLVKWNLLRDAALRRRTDEALVRIVVPVTGTEDEAFRLASSMANALMSAVTRALPS
jgi:EpsI family protein